MDVNIFYNDLLYQYVVSVRRLADQLWTNRDVSLDRLLHEGYVCSTYGQCLGFYQSLMALFIHCDSIPRPVFFRDLLHFPHGVVIDGLHFDARFLLDFYPEVHTMEDAIIDTIKRNPEKYLREADNL